jgi:hypothetical protein
MKDILMVNEFLDVFLEELLGLPLKQEIEVSLDSFLKVPPIAQKLYRMALKKLNKPKT